MSPVAVMYSWFNENKGLFVSVCNELEFKDTGRGSACVNLDTASHIISVCAWDHAFCLDIQVLDTRKEQSKFPHMGDCASIIEFKEHLAEFYLWFKSEYKNIA